MQYILSLIKYNALRSQQFIQSKQKLVQNIWGLAFFKPREFHQNRLQMNYFFQLTSGSLTFHWVKTYIDLNKGTPQRFVLLYKTKITMRRAQIEPTKNEFEKKKYIFKSTRLWILILVNYGISVKSSAWKRENVLNTLLRLHSTKTFIQLKKTTRIKAKPWMFRLPFKVYGAVITWKTYV